MVDAIHYWSDRGHPMHYWRWIVTGWGIAVLGAFPTLSFVSGSEAIWPFGVLACFPGLAHLYGFLANLKQLRHWGHPGHVGPALVGLCYLLAVLIGGTQMDLFLALTLPITSVIISTLSFGVYFTGFLPLLAFWLVHLLLSPSVTTRSFVFSIILMTSSWMIGLFTGFFLGGA